MSFVYRRIHADYYGEQYLISLESQEDGIATLVVDQGSPEEGQGARNVLNLEMDDLLKFQQIIKETIEDLERSI